MPSLRSSISSPAAIRLVSSSAPQPSDPLPSPQRKRCEILAKFGSFYSLVCAVEKEAQYRRRQEESKLQWGAGHEYKEYQSKLPPKQYEGRGYMKYWFRRKRPGARQ
ncbi:unnamed protein product [Vitrella brassicaformis CCMP3155]|uniref:Uncharacterized protein n=1 Tax=Vitrella brassicaformis (strain CCMP3155) TaxID=1169540 RepID=A0A0G4GDN0_VITBC|nr:unnamed protein product [Vitrella brassicaformis CCMP3155]|eukprot:CEM27484.1 unnamed protein product [Vitrella brassicaformis CCMP3155]